MAEFLISRDLLRSPGHSPSTPSPGPRPGGGAERQPPRNAGIEGRWIGEDGETPLGAAFPIEAGSPQVEAFAPSGNIEHVSIQTGLSFDAEPPSGASALKVSEGGRELAHVALAAARTPPPMPAAAPIRFGPPGAKFVYPVFSERFSSQTPFQNAVQSLYDWILAVPPFDRADVRAGFAIDAYFWPSANPYGHFNTRDIAYDCKHPPALAVTFLGDNDLARAKLKPFMLEGRYGLILINSAVRGGAGGMAEYCYPAWASITSCPNETWQAVALHEIGHGLGLADEYRDSGRAGEAPRGEPNVATSSTPASASWADILTDQPPSSTCVFSLERQSKIEAGQVARPAADFVGLFQGARYRNDLYRASLNCLMRSTAIPHFCRVCARSIIARIAD